MYSNIGNVSGYLDTELGNKRIKDIFHKIPKIVFTTFCNSVGKGFFNVCLVLPSTYLRGGILLCFKQISK